MRLCEKLKLATKNHGVETATRLLSDGIREGKIKRRDISLKEMAISFMGDDWAQKLNQLRGESIGRENFRESASAVDASSFSAITGQLLIDTVREKYEFATKIGNEIFDTRTISNGNLGTQIEPWLGRVAETELTAVNQGMPYPTAKFGPQYVTYPGPEKYGEICHVTMEMIYSDLTGQAYESAESVGEIVGLWEEYKKLAIALGLVNNHNWNGTAYNTYLTSGSWVNSLESFTLASWRDVNTVEQLFANMLDPVTSKPIEIGGMTMLVVPNLAYTAKRIVSATEIREGDITTGNGTQTLSPNVVPDYKMLSSKHMRNILINGGGGVASGFTTAARADTYTLWGNPKKAFLWRQAEPMKTVQAPPQNILDFNQDIVLSVKARVWGVACVRDPRYVVLARNTSA